jgi:hypothetical protein
LVDATIITAPCSTKNNWARTVKVAYRQPSKGKVTDLVIDSTGLKVFDEGEWKVRKYGAESGARVDPATHDIVAAEMSLDNVHDPLRCCRHCSTQCVASWGVFMQMAPMTAEPVIS